MRWLLFGPVQHLPSTFLMIASTYADTRAEAPRFGRRPLELELRRPCAWRPRSGPAAQADHVDELEWAPTESWRFGAGVAYVDAIIKNVLGRCCTGPNNNQRINGDFVPGNAPRWTASALARYTFPVGSGRRILPGRRQLSSRFWFNLTDLPVVEQSGFGLANVRLNYTPAGGKLEIGASVENLADSTTARWASTTPRSRPGAGLPRHAALVQGAHHLPFLISRHGPGGASSGGPSPAAVARRDQRVVSTPVASPERLGPMMDLCVSAPTRRRNQPQHGCQVHGEVSMSSLPNAARRLSDKSVRSVRARPYGRTVGGSPASVCTGILAADQTAPITAKPLADELEQLWNERLRTLYRRLARRYPRDFMKLLDSAIDFFVPKFTSATRMLKEQLSAEGVSVRVSAGCLAEFARIASGGRCAHAPSG